MGLQVRHAVAVVVRRDLDLILAVRRPDEPGEELPGIWGLPAATLREGESPEDGVRRLGRDKLGVELTPLQSIGEGEQQRSGYTLRMTLFEASLRGEPRPTGQARLRRAAPPPPEQQPTLYDAIDWLPETTFGEAAARGSLCCRLLLRTIPATSD